MSTQIILKQKVEFGYGDVSVVVSTTTEGFSVEAEMPTAYMISLEAAEDVALIAEIFRNERLAVFEVICKLVGQARRAL